MGEGTADVDQLPPESRFAVRALAAGIGPDEIDALLRTQGTSERGALRAAVRLSGGPTLPHGADDDALLAALAPVLAAAQSPPRRVPGTACPTADIVAALAGGGLDGPLLLATAEHTADCPTCMTALVAARSAPSSDVPAEELVPPLPLQVDQRPVVFALGLLVVLLTLLGLAVVLVLPRFVF